jgi:hypothetical protein
MAYEAMFATGRRNSRCPVEGAKKGVQIGGAGWSARGCADRVGVRCEGWADARVDI